MYKIGEGNGTPLQYSCLENPMDGGAWKAVVCGVAEGCQHPLDHQKSKKSSRKTSPSTLIDYAKAFDCVDHNKMWKILQEMGIPDHLTCLLRNLSAGQEATVGTGHGTTDGFQIRKGGRQGCVLLPC